MDRMEIFICVFFHRFSCIKVGAITINNHFHYCRLSFVQFFHSFSFLSAANDTRRGFLSAHERSGLYWRIKSQKGGEKGKAKWVKLYDGENS
jgi:hypothetical protein